MSETPPPTNSSNNPKQPSPEKFVSTFYGPEDEASNKPEESSSDQNYADQLDHFIASLGDSPSKSNKRNQENTTNTNNNDVKTNDLKGEDYENFYFGNNDNTSDKKTNDLKGEDYENFYFGNNDNAPENNSNDTSSNTPEDSKDEDAEYRDKIYHLMGDENPETTENSSEDNNPTEEEPNEPSPKKPIQPKGPTSRTQAVPGGAGWGVNNEPIFEPTEEVTNEPLEEVPNEPLEPNEIIGEAGTRARTMFENIADQEALTAYNEALQELEIVRSRYADLTAKRRGELLGKSKFDLQEAKHDYEVALNKLNSEIMIQLTRMDVPKEEARAIVLESTIFQNEDLMNAIADSRIEASSNKKFAKFYHWFGQQKGFKGRIKKMVAVGVLTAPLGIAAGAAGMTLLGPVAGAIAGAGIAKGITRALASGKISKEAGANSLAEQERVENVAAATEAIHQWMNANPGKTPSADIITEISEATTKKRLNENRRRTGKLMTIGALAGIISGYAGSYIANHDFGGGNKTIPPNSPPPSSQPEINIPPNPDLPPPTIPVGDLSGYPWNWANSILPAGKNPSTFLTDVVLRAKAAGVNLNVHEAGGPGTTWYDIDGATDTKTIVDALRPFIKPEDLA